MGKSSKYSESAAFFAVLHAEIHLWNELDVAFKQAGLPIGLGRFLPLYYLAQEPMRLQELAKCCHNKESAASRLVNRMQKDGLITKQPDACDKRAVMLHLTENGRALEKQACSVFNKKLEELFSTCTAEELQRLTEVLGALCGEPDAACGASLSIKGGGHD